MAAGEPRAARATVSEEVTVATPAPRLFGALLLSALCAGCVYVPRTTEVYDEDCRIQAKQMTLDLQQVGGFAGCSNQGCVALLVALGAVTVASAVVSGSIVLAGNAVYWFEKRGSCIPQTTR